MDELTEGTKALIRAYVAELIAERGQLLEVFHLGQSTRAVTALDQPGERFFDVEPGEYLLVRAHQHPSGEESVVLRAKDGSETPPLVVKTKAGLTHLGQALFRGK